MIWKSVVGKLWATILLLVGFVLFVLTMFLLQFFQRYHVNEIEDDLKRTAAKVSFIMEEHENLELALEITGELVDQATRVIVFLEEGDQFYLPNDRNVHLPVDVFTEDNLLPRILATGESVELEISPPGEVNTDEYSHVKVVGTPFIKPDGENGVAFIYQSLEVVRDTANQTTKLILLAAGIAFVLTTIFAFFLSTRITAPLLKMREAAFEVAREKFDTKVPILTNDEIGELATAFNQMGKQLKYNMSALRQEKEQLSSILSSMADGVITLNRDGTILMTNPPAERFLQYWYYDKSNTQIIDGLPAKVYDLFQSAVLTEQEQTGEISLQMRTWTVIVSPLYNQSSVRGAVAVVRDMTEERKMDKIRKDFIANVSHELRTPISMLQGYSEAIVDDIASSDEEKKEIAKVIYDESLRMGRLVNDLLDLASIEAGHITVYHETLELYHYLDRVLKKFSGIAKEKEIVLELKGIEKDDTFAFDEDKIEQVLTNLIDNAIRHTPGGGKVQVQGKVMDKGLLLEVMDTGSGILEEDLPFVFERFYKGDKSRTRGRSGTGLGLSIAKNIIDAHEGHISVQSKVGQGTTFSIFIPRKSRENDK
ncbi:two-component system sensor histidine kinase ResE [Bacillus oleivorans]|uniref:histidine kinase n=1 Tax=Bacillus oleivorans TaxID=1448271 RepID=A0A285CKL9_9BACI|nr:ATP-binding protein [Bacillus oleivorans]SNX68102.1 two-component system sensor histidine kinase ResE [Bacillus oleivorans]